MGSTIAVVSRRVAAWFCLIGVLVEWLGFHWDISWHTDRGRDTFFTGPHLMIVGGLALAAVAAVAALQRVGLRARPGMLLVATSVALTGVALAVDQWFHSEFGVDVGIWSPPHLFLSLTIMLGLVGVIADYGRRADVRPLTLALLSGAFLAVSSLLLDEYDLGYPHFGIVWSPIALAAVYGIAMGMATRVAPLRWSATIAVGAALAIRGAGIAFNASLGRSIPVPPVGLLAGAVVFDLARRRTRAAVALALAWVAAFAVEVPWLLAVGKTWWVPPVLVPGLVAGALFVVLAAGLGRAVGALALGQRPERRVLVPAALVVIAVAASGWGQLDSDTSTLQASYRSTAHRLEFSAPRARAADWVTVSGPSVAQGLFTQAPPDPGGLTVIAGSYAPLVQGPRLRAIRSLPKLNLSWLGGLRWRDGRFSGPVAGSGEWLAIWYVRGNRVFASVVERGTSGPLELAEQALAPARPADPWAAPLGVAGLMVLTALALWSAGAILGRDGDALVTNDYGLAMDAGVPARSV